MSDPELRRQLDALEIGASHTVTRDWIRRAIDQNDAQADMKTATIAIEHGCEWKLVRTGVLFRKLQPGPSGGAWPNPSARRPDNDH